MKKKTSSKIQLNSNPEDVLRSSDILLKEEDFLGALTLANSYCSKVKYSSRDRDCYRILAYCYQHYDLYEQAIHNWILYTSSLFDKKLLDEAYVNLMLDFAVLGDNSNAYFYNSLISDRSIADGYEFGGEETSFLPEERKESVFYTPEEYKKTEQDELEKLLEEMSEKFKEFTSNVDGDKFLSLDEYRKEKSREIINKARRCADKEDNHEEAFNLLSQIKKGDPNYFLAREMMANFASFCNKEEEGLKICKDLYDEGHKNMNVIYPLVQNAIAVGDEQLARNILLEVGMNRKKYGEEVSRMSHLCIMVGLYDLAYDFVNKFDDYEEVLLLLKSIAAYDCGKKQECLNHLKQAQELYPNSIVCGFYVDKIKKGIKAVDDGGEFKPLGLDLDLPEDLISSLIVMIFMVYSCKPKDAEEVTKNNQIFEDAIHLCFEKMYIEGMKDVRNIALAACVRARKFDVMEYYMTDPFVDDEPKRAALYELVESNIYYPGHVFYSGQEYFYAIYDAEIGRKKRKPFLKAYAKAYVEYILREQRDAKAFAKTVEGIYYSFSEKAKTQPEVWKYADKTNELAAVMIFSYEKDANNYKSIKECTDLMDAELDLARLILEIHEQ